MLWNGGKNKIGETTIDDIGRLGVGLQLFFFTLSFLMNVFPGSVLFRVPYRGGPPPPPTHMAGRNGLAYPHAGFLSLHPGLAFSLSVLRRSCPCCQSPR